MEDINNLAAVFAFYKMAGEQYDRINLSVSQSLTLSFALIRVPKIILGLLANGHTQLLFFTK